MSVLAGYICDVAQSRNPQYFTHGKKYKGKFFQKIQTPDPTCTYCPGKASLVREQSSSLGFDLFSL